MFECASEVVINELICKVRAQGLDVHRRTSSERNG